MNKKKIFGLSAATLVAVAIVANVRISRIGSSLSDVSLANVEALAKGESDQMFCDVMTPCVINIWYDCSNYWIIDGILYSKTCEYRWAQ